jgi:hypothetical protein
MDEEYWHKGFQRLALREQLELLAFEAELAKMPRPFVAAFWEAIARVDHAKVVDTCRTVSAEKRVVSELRWPIRRIGS